MSLYELSVLSKGGIISKVCVNQSAHTGNKISNWSYGYTQKTNFLGYILSSSMGWRVGGRGPKLENYIYIYESAWHDESLLDTIYLPLSCMETCLICIPLILIINN